LLVCNSNLHRCIASPERGSLAKGLDVSFSKVKYYQIAPFVGLEPSLYLRDAPTIEMHRARIPNALFKDIIEDIEIVMKQYGPPSDHQNEEAGSRFLAPAGF
jgi:hypothetical protein